MKNFINKILSTDFKAILFYSLLGLMVLPCTNILHFQKLKGHYTITPSPTLSSSSWLDGSYQEQQEKHTAERTLFRNVLVRLKNQIQFSLHDKVNAKQAVLGKENYLYEKNYINAYLGRDFIGKEKIKQKVQQLKTIQDELKSRQVDFLVVFAPGKGNFYPEHIPDTFDPEIKSLSNYNFYVQEFNNQNVNFIDANAWFINMKDTSAYPLYPKCGIHWSEYGEYLVIDSLLKYIETALDINLPKLTLNKIAQSRKMQGRDDDIEQAMNLLFNIPDLEMAYPQYTFNENSNTVKPKTIIVADSFYWGMFKKGIHQKVFNNGEFWYYSKQIYSNDPYNYLLVKEVDINQKLEKQDIVILLSTDANLFNFPFGFADQAIDALFNNEVSGKNKNNRND